MAERPKGYADWTPQAETAAVIEQVQGVLREYRDFLPMTVRQIFYRLVGAHGYDKTELAYKRLCNYLVRARRAQMIPFHAIRDDGTTSLGGGGWDSPAEWWEGERSAAAAYRRDRMAGQDTRIEVWCEAAGMAPQLARVARPYSIPVYSTGGFSSVTVTKEIADRALQSKIPTVFLHIGDYDPSGESIYESMSQDARTFVLQTRRHRGRPDADIAAHRVALTADQVDEHDLPTAPPKSSDTRSANWIGETCQAEAMPPDLLAQIVDTAIRDRIDLELWEEIVAEEQDERDEIVAAVDQFLDERDDDA